MENVEIKDLEKKESKKEDKKPAKKAAPKKEELSTRQIFMIQCNERRAAAKLPQAYSEEEIKAAK